MARTVIVRLTVAQANALQHAADACADDVKDFFRTVGEQRAYWRACERLRLARHKNPKAAGEGV